MTITLEDTSAATRNVKSLPLSSWNFALSYAPVTQVVTPGSTTTGSDGGDSNVTVHTSATVDNIANVMADDVVPGTLDAGATFSAVTPVVGGASTVASVDQNGRVTRLSDGTVRVLCETQWLTCSIDIAISRTTGSSATVWNYFLSGSAALDAYNTIVSGIAGKTGGSYSAQAIWYTRDDVNAIYTWNTANFLPGVDLTAISPWNSDQGHNKSGTLISPRHFVNAHHYLIATGSTIRFIKADGTVWTGKVIDQAQVYLGVAQTDLQVCLLGDLSGNPVDVPSGISFAKVIPDNGWIHLPGIQYLTVPMIVTNQDKSISLDVVDPRTAIFTGGWAGQHPADPTWETFSISLRSGDSGSPAFMVIGGEMVLLGTLFSAGIGVSNGAGPGPSGLHSEVNTVMATLSNTNGLSPGEIAAGHTPYQLTDFDFSGYTP